MDSSIRACTETRDFLVNPEDLPRLWASVMHNAIEDLERADECCSAANWFISNVTYVGSYLWVCDVLNLNPKIIRVKFKTRIYFQFMKEQSC
jgi:hypothetical protein